MEIQTPKQAKEKEKDKEEKDDEEMYMPQLSLIPKIRSSPKKLPSKKIPLGEEIKADIQESDEKIVYKSGWCHHTYEESKGKQRETNFLTSLCEKERLNDSQDVGNQADDSIRSYK